MIFEGKFYTFKRKKWRRALLDKGFSTFQVIYGGDMCVIGDRRERDD